jgi:hypothetical protein
MPRRRGTTSADRGEQLLELGGPRDVAPRAGRQICRDLAPPRRRDAVNHHAVDVGDAHQIAGTERRGELPLRVGLDALRRLAQTHRHAEHGVEAERPGRLGERGQRLRLGTAAPLRIGDRRVSGERQHLLGALVVRHLEMRRHVGLEGEEVQQPLAEGVDRLDLEAARRLHGAREETPRQHEVLGVGGRCAGLDDLLAQRAVVERGPLRQLAEHTRAHLGRCRLGEGQAQDLRGRHAHQQEAHHPLRQHVGLAGAGIGRDPDRALRVGGQVLARSEVRGDDEGGHASASPASDHSRTRARWSYSP